MFRYFKKASELASPSARENEVCDGVQSHAQHENAESGGTTCAPVRANIDVNLKNLPADPGVLPRISSYHPNVQEKIRRAYLQKGPFQPKGHNFPRTKFSNGFLRFSPKWFDEFSGWLEYSIEKDVVYCLYCYLFKSDKGGQGGGEQFVSEGFRSWKKKERLNTHVGGPNSAHHQAYVMCENLLNQMQHIETVFEKHTEQEKLDYKACLYASIDCVRFLLRQGLAFRGHDESADSINKENFRELLNFLSIHSEEIKRVVLSNAPKNLQLTSLKIQKEIVQACAVQTIRVIVDDLGDAFFSLLVDESRDISIKEQMVVAIRYVDRRGFVVERVIGFVHVLETSAISLKKGIEELLSKHNLSIARMRGQGYDGASNMQGEFNGLNALFLKENESAFYIHCFAHQLQLTIVTVAQHHKPVATFFELVALIVNMVGGSCKRKDLLREKQAENVKKALESHKISTGKGRNQETSLKRASEIRWSTHLDTCLYLIAMYPAVIKVLEFIDEDGELIQQRAKASSLFDTMYTFDFAFILHIMKEILLVTCDLSKALQRKDQDIVNAMHLVELTKRRLQELRDNEWDSILIQVSIFCNEHDIIVPNINEKFVVHGRPRRRVEEITNLHHYRVEFFYTVIDMQLQELNNRFTEVNTELLLCMACFNPAESFLAFDEQKLLRLAQLYSLEFSEVDRLVLRSQLKMFIMDMRSNEKFFNLKGISDLAKKLVETKKHVVYNLVYLLLTLALVLPVATATVERAFSAMHILKNRLRNKMGDELMSDCLITYIEKDIFDSLDNDTIANYFQEMTNR